MVFDIYSQKGFMKKLFFGSIIFIFCLLPAIPAQTIKPKEPPLESLSSSGTKVDGLELPGDQSVNFDEGFVNIQAKCKGEVKWLVISQAKVKYVPMPPNALIVSIPPQNGTVVTIFAIGNVDGKLTDFARTNVTITGGTPGPPSPGPGPPPGPNPPGPVAQGPLHVTFVIDFNNTTPELAALLNSPTLRQGITTKGNFFRIYDSKSPVVTQKKLDGVVSRVGGNAALVIQRNDGFVVDARVVPRTEAEILAIITKFGGPQ